jgi:hypothetical protein
MSGTLTPGQYEALLTVWQRYKDACRSRWYAIDSELDDATLSAVEDRRRGARTALLAVGQAMGAGDSIADIRDALDTDYGDIPKISAEESRRLRTVGLG